MKLRLINCYTVKFASNCSALWTTWREILTLSRTWSDKQKMRGYFVSCQLMDCGVWKLHRLLPGRVSLEGCVPSFYLMVFAPGELKALKQDCLPGKGVVWHPFGQDTIGWGAGHLNHGATLLWLSCCQLPCFPLPPGTAMLWDVLWAVLRAHAHTTVLILLAQDWTKGNCFAHHCQVHLQKHALLSLLPEEHRPMDLLHARHTGRKCQSNQCTYLHTQITFSYWDIFRELGLTLLPLRCHHRLSAAAPFSFEILRRSSQQSSWF